MEKQVLFVMVLNKIILTDNDKERAKKSNIILFDEKDLSYYENLINHLGPAAKYQVFLELKIEMTFGSCFDNCAKTLSENVSK